MLLLPVMSASAKNLPEGLKDSECERGNIVNRPPIPYVEPADANGKQETTKIKVKIPDGTNRTRWFPSNPGPMRARSLTSLLSSNFWSRRRWRKT